MTRNASRIALVLLGLALLLTSTPVPAQAQANRELVISPDSASVYGLPQSGRLPVETHTAEVRFPFRLTIPGPSVCFGVPMRVQYDVVSADPYVIFSLSKREEVRAYEGNVGSWPNGFASTETFVIADLETALSVSFTRQAPAFRDSKITIQAQPFGGQGLQQDQCSVTDGNPVAAEISVKPDYFASLSVVPQDTVVVGDQNPRVTIRNMGNGPTRVTAFWLTTSEAQEQASFSALTETDAEVGIAELLLDSKVFSGQAAQDEAAVSLQLSSAPADWSGDVLFVGRSDIAVPDLQEARVTVTLDRVEAKAQPAEGAKLPGPEFGLLVTALGAVFASRRRP